MIPYLIVYSYVVSIYLLKKTDKKINNKFIGILAQKETVFMILFLFAALRGNGNGDYFKYIENVQYVDSLQFVWNPHDFPFELGYRVIAFFVNILNLNPQVVIMAMNAISIYAVYRFVIKYSKNPYLSAVLFFPFMLIFDMHHSRSAIAISLGLWVIAFLYEKKYLKSLLMLLIAYSFHRSALVILVFAPFILLTQVDSIQMRLSTLKNQKIVVILFLVGVFTVFTPMRIILILLNNPVTAGLHYKIVSYLANDQWSYPFKIYDPRFILLILMYILFIKVYSYKDKFTNKLMIALLIAIFSILTFRISTILTMRIYNFFNIFTIALIPNVIELDPKLTLSDNSMLNKYIKGIKKEFLVEISFNILIIAFMIYTLALITKQFEYFFFF